MPAMMELRYTLLSDGSSDRALIPIINWLFRRIAPRSAIQWSWADFGRRPKPHQKLSDRIAAALDLYPADWLFIHRDAEKMSIEEREREIEMAVEEFMRGAKKSSKEKTNNPTHICVVPVRMTEAWLLTSEKAIRMASGNPNGKVPLDIPPLRELENLADPKEKLHALLREASGLSGRRRKKFNEGQHVQNS